MPMIDEIKSKIETNKKLKEQSLLENAYRLFSEKGVDNTSISDIVKAAGVAKGTFYLYFKDKNDINDKLVSMKTQILFNNALEAMYKSDAVGFIDRLIFVVNHVIDALIDDPIVMNFIKRDLTLGFYTKEMDKLLDQNALGVYELFKQGVEENHIHLDNIDVTFFMIIELIGSTCYSCIVKSRPVDIYKFKPYLFESITKMLAKQ